MVYHGSWGTVARAVVYHGPAKGTENGTKKYQIQMRIVVRTQIRCRDPAANVQRYASSNTGAMLATGLQNHLQRRNTTKTFV